MKPGRFSYEAPDTIEAALASLAANGDDAKIIAGGQSLAPMLNLRLARPEHLVDINGLGELGQVHLDGDRLMIGAMVRHAALGKNELVRRHCPMLAHAAKTIGHYAIRQRGTLGGSLAHADPAAQLPLTALALDAEIELRSTTGTRTVAARDFFLSIFTTVIKPDELLVAVRVPPPRLHEGWGFCLFNRRAGDFAIVSVAATVACAEGGGMDRLRLAIGGIGPVPVRVEDMISGEIAGPMEEGWSARVAAATAATVEIEENEQMPGDFRRELVAALTKDALDQALERAR
jgi:aerobic carbon-monoxide dehydrogenase medium subunit